MITELILAGALAASGAPSTEEVFWLLPETVVSLPSGNTPEIWPQTHLPDGVVPCGRFAQVDLYKTADIPALIADAMLYDGEDYGVVISWRFVAGPECAPVEEPPVEEQPPAVVPPLVCEEGTVPGWLDENGDPTSCVGDQPDISEPRPVVVPVEAAPLPEPVDTLPVTGPALLDQLAALGMVLLGAGGGLLAWRWKAVRS